MKRIRDEDEINHYDMAFFRGSINKDQDIMAIFNSSVWGSKDYTEEQKSRRSSFASVEENQHSVIASISIEGDYA